MKKIYEVLQKTLGSELGNELAQEVAMIAIETTGGKLEKLIAIFHAVGKAWAPLMLHWRNWIIEKSTNEPVLIMRDAAPLSVLPISNAWKQAWLNRLLCGVDDELCSDGAKKNIDSLVYEYIKQENLHVGFSFLDGGCWGSIVLMLFLKFKLPLDPLFFFSHNPNIPGFLNELELPEKIGELLNDSLECAFLKTVKRPSEFMKKDGVVIPKLEEQDFIIKILGEATLQGLQEEALSISNFPLEDVSISIDRLIKLSQIATNGIFTGILHRNSPTWSEGQNFLAAWPKHLKWTK